MYAAAGGRHLEIWKRISFAGGYERMPPSEGGVIGLGRVLDFVQQEPPVGDERFGKRVQGNVDLGANGIGPVHDPREHGVVDSNAQRRPRGGQLGSADRVRVYPLSLEPDRHKSPRYRGATRSAGPT